MRITGETLGELERNVTEAIKMCLQAHLEDFGPEMPRPVRRWDIQVDSGTLTEA